MLDQLNTQKQKTTEDAKLGTVDLSDCILDGRAIIGRCTETARNEGQSSAVINGFLQEAFSCNLTGLLELVARKFDVVLDEE